MAAYLIVHAAIDDWEQYQKYTRVTPEIVERFGGRFIARGGEKVTLEGPEEDVRVVLIEFPDLDSAVRFYNSDEYSAAREIRRGAARARFVAVDGVD